MEESQDIKHFGTVDFIIFGGSLLTAILIGIYYAIKDRKKSNTDAYYFGERQMSPIPLGLSISVTFISAILVIGYPTEAYLVGLVFIWFSVASIIPTMVACLLYIPLVHRLNLSTINQVFYMSMTVYIPGIALSAVTPFGLKTTIVMTSVICVFYTTLGGMKAVVWTDTLQSFVMLSGLIAVLIRTTMLVGGFGNIWDALERGERTNMFNFNVDPTIRNSFWSIIIGHAFLASSPRQAVIQRYLSCKSVCQARKAAAVAMMPNFIFVVLAVLNGTAMYAYYENCDPLMSHKIQKPDQMMPYLVVDIFQDLPGLAGLYVAAGFSGTLSTVSSGINALAVLLTEDFIIPKRPNLSQAAKIAISKVIVICFGISVMAIAMAVGYLNGTVIRILRTLAGAIGGPVLGLFTLGLFFPWATTKGVIIGQIVATGISLWIGLCSFLYGKSAVANRELPASIDGCSDTMFFNTTQALAENESFQPTTFVSNANSESHGLESTLYAISYLYYAPLATLTTIVVGLIASFITGPNKPADADPALFVPIISHPIFPAKVRAFFRFGVPHYMLSSEQKSEEDSDTLEDFPFVSDANNKKEAISLDESMNLKDTEV